MSALPRPVIEVEGLRIRFGAGAPYVVDGLSFSLNPGECLALVGESGSGKSVTSRSLVGLAGPGAHVTAKRLHLDGEDVARIDDKAWRRIRGSRVGFVMQDALGSLDPLRTVGDEIAEPLRLHQALSKKERQARVIDLLRSVGVPEPEIRAQQHPYQLSGGLRQRALIASAIACGPALLIADEPTTALDAVVQAQVLALLESLRSANAAMLIVSHDLMVVSRLADRVAVMRHGKIVEQGPTAEVLRRPRHPYTKSLVAAAVSVHAHDFASSRKIPSSSPFVIEAEGLAKAFPHRDGKRRSAVSDVSFSLRLGETLGIVGESGSGKTTVSRLVLGLEKPDAGTVRLQGRPWSSLTAKQQRTERRRIQVVFQDPLASFDPRYTVERVIGEALEVSGYRSAAARKARTVELLKLVRLGEDILRRRPIELSGGQRQRVAIARALAPQPEVLVCDEPVSALDVSVQKQILDILDDLKRRLGLSCLFISHDLGVIRRVSDRVLVMRNGVVVEEGETAEVFARPRHPYTISLLNAIPRLETEKEEEPLYA